MVKFVLNWASNERAKHWHGFQMECICSYLEFEAFRTFYSKLFWNILETILRVRLQFGYEMVFVAKKLFCRCPFWIECLQKAFAFEIHRPQLKFIQRNGCRHVESMGGRNGKTRCHICCSIYDTFSFSLHKIISDVIGWPSKEYA